ncbi:MAG TPA: cytochrome c [Saprospiraceae bacterium]|nr:cytochrome c [Saprospiraceae bacterium]
MQSESLKLRTGIGLTTMILILIAFMSLQSCNTEPPKNSRIAQAKLGKEHYMNYCSSCHGEDGKGKKVEGLTKQPLDLTTIVVDRRVSNFPILEIANIIDGRKMVEAHGTREMPIWGEVFSTGEYLNENEIKGRLAELIAYLMSIQESRI